MNVHSYVAGLNQPEAGGVTAVLKEPVPGREANIRGSLREHGSVVPGHAVQEGVGGQSRRGDLNHGNHRQFVVQVGSRWYGRLPVARDEGHLRSGPWASIESRAPRIAELGCAHACRQMRPHT